jgi:hypothetical protein
MVPTGALVSSTSSLIFLMVLALRTDLVGNGLLVQVHRRCTGSPNLKSVGGPRNFVVRATTAMRVRLVSGQMNQNFLLLNATLAFGATPIPR